MTLDEAKALHQQVTDLLDRKQYAKARAFMRQHAIFEGIDQKKDEDLLEAVHYIFNNEASPELTEAEALFEQGNEHYKKGDFQEALDCFLEVTNMGEQGVVMGAVSLEMCYTNTGLMYLEMNEY
jgi:tetratricopeptide (TPR) repeat protein